MIMETTVIAGSNPLAEINRNEHGAPAFDRVRAEHFEPAFDAAIEIAREEVARVAGATESPTFENTVEALERCGEMLEGVSSVFFSLNAACTGEEMQEVARRVAPRLAAFQHEVYANTRLFERVRSARESDPPATADARALLDKTWRAFVNGGALLEGEARERFKGIAMELSRLSLEFERKVLAETNNFMFHATDEAALSGIPEGARAMAAEEAARRGLSGWVFTLHEPSYAPFMMYADDRAAREYMYRGRASRGARCNEHDTRDTIKQISALRLEKARLLGYKSHAERVLAERMAGNPEAVRQFISQLLVPARAAAERELRDVVALARREGFTGALQAWDWGYYSNKLRKERFAIDDEMTRPYFSLERAQEGIFELARRLYGIAFRPSSAPLYHEEVTCFEVVDSDEQFLGLLYLDYFPRENKEGGAWMTCFREQAGARRPLVSMVMNFTRPAGGKPALLTLGEVKTLLHEFGHALHALLSRCAYASISGTNVYRDFVELPSQLLENWAAEKEWLDSWAAHYETGERIPASLVEAIRRSSNFANGYACCRQLGFSALDMAWHAIEQEATDIDTLEREALQAFTLLPPVDGASISASFKHIFSGGYAAGYYGYKWAEVLDADAFSMFKQNGIFDPATASAFRAHVLERGASEHPMTLYKRFRGSSPTIFALLEREGWPTISKTT